MTTIEYRPKTPPAVQNLLIANCVVFLAMTLLDQMRIYELFALFPVPSPFFEIWQPVTYMFMHGDFSHLFFNMFALWMFGRGLEQELGTKRFLIYYLVCGIGAALVQLGTAQIDIMRLSEASIAYQQYLCTPTVGASGAVFGLLLAFGMLHPNATIMLLIPPIPMKAKWFVVIYGLIELIFGVSGRMDSVAHFAHIGGMFWGWLLLMWWKYQDRKRYRY
ncbi:MAG: rhomboid family intramembrane serine protease [Alistipes sp.]|nr:rhomboid family intramembrane serine protease [Alistipes sp.]